MRVVLAAGKPKHDDGLSLNLRRLSAAEDGVRVARRLLQCPQHSSLQAGPRGVPLKLKRQIGDALKQVRLISAVVRSDTNRNSAFVPLAADLLEQDGLLDLAFASVGPDPSRRPLSTSHSATVAPFTAGSDPRLN